MTHHWISLENVIEQQLNLSTCLPVHLLAGFRLEVGRDEGLRYADIGELDQQFPVVATRVVIHGSGQTHPVLRQVCVRDILEINLKTKWSCSSVINTMNTLCNISLYLILHHV